MIETLIYFVIVIVIVGVVVWVLTLLLDRLPLDGTIKEVGKVLLLVIAVLILLLYALRLVPMIG